MKQRPRYGNACFPRIPAASTFTPAKSMRDAAQCGGVNEASGG